ncbi:beta galactosidase jelly roll domain-containing protein [Haladaptatus salinisoli]|uniref:beta galactosidase jelly roll domain-containing protein n=1 Tax=Haladaptatus salinisoli TaxID=2884876 RepID=UPI001D0AF423|nr:beta galactosidase jelly roll domain-containing protein [Haladaptatus salinisoli]
MSATDTITVSGSGFEYTFDKVKGRLTSMKRDEEELLASGPRLNVWRTPISNENVSWGAAEVEEWRDAGLDRLEQTVNSVSVESVADQVTRIRFETTVSAPGEDASFATDYLYHVLGTGDVLLGVRATPNDALKQAISSWIGRVGVQLELRDSLQQFNWYGRGPQETYPDRKTGTKVGVHGGTVADQYVPYVRPQDYGNKTDVQWATLTDGSGGLAAFGHPSLNVSAHHISPENLDRALFDYQIEDGDAVTLNLDHAVTGVGGTPIQTLPEYRVVPDDSFSFVVGLRPLTDEESPMALSRRNLPYAFASADTFGNLTVDFDVDTGRLDVSAVVRNTGGDPAEINAPLKIDGEVVATETVSLQPGTKTRVSFERNIEVAGIFEVTVDDLPPRLLTMPRISLAGEWLFHRSDDFSWKAPSLDDSEWETVTLPANWEDHSDYTENPVYGWFRKHFTVPAEWEGHALKIPVGKIDDADETFLNGAKIGQTGTFPENGYETAWSQARRYTVQPENVNFGGENVLAIRVYDGGGGGGIYGGPLGPITAAD